LNADKVGAAGVLSIGAAPSGVAGSVTQPGETLGSPNGAPAPPGFYFANIANWGCRNTSQQHTCVGINIPVFFWSTPATIFGGRLQLTLAPATGVEVGIQNTAHFSGSCLIRLRRPKSSGV
jgi:hypothetical protein